MSGRVGSALQLVGVGVRRRLVDGWLVGAVLGLGLLGGAATPAQATVPGLNGKIALTRGDIWAINPDGGQATNLTNEYNPSPDVGARFCGASWSPNGAQIAYLEYPRNPGPTDYGDAFYQPELVVANADGSNPRVLLAPAALDEWHPAVFSCYKPAWSPDGTQIAYTGGPQFIHSTAGKLYVLHADGTGAPVEISDGAGWDSAPAWSPDGTRIAFNSINRSGSPDGIYTTSPAGGPPHYLAPGNDPNWSPDGKTLAITRPFTGPDGTYSELWTISGSDGSTINDLGQGWSPSWSADGSKIVFHSWDHQNTFNLFTINPDGSGLTQLTSDGNSHQPDWQSLPCTTSSSSSSGGGSVSVNCRVGV